MHLAADYDSYWKISLKHSEPLDCWHC